MTTTSSSTNSDLPAQLRRRRAASWRCEPLASGSRDPWAYRQPNDWTGHELAALAAAADHLRSHGLYGRWQVAESARQAWQRRHGQYRREVA